MYYVLCIIYVILIIDRLLDGLFCKILLKLNYNTHGFINYYFCG